MNIFIGSSNEIAEHQADSKSFLFKVANIVQSCHHNPLRWTDSSMFVPGSFTLESLINNINDKEIDAGIFICSEKDKTWYSGTEGNKPMPKGNVLFECGLYMGRLGRKNAIIVKHGKVDLPSDFSGLNYANFSNDSDTTGEGALIDWLNSLNAGKATPSTPASTAGVISSNTDTVTTQEPDNPTQAHIVPPTLNPLIELAHLKPGVVRASDGRQLTLGHPLAIAKYPITKGIYDKVMHNVEASVNASTLPVTYVSFFDAVDFCNKLSMLNHCNSVYTISDNKVIRNRNVDGYRLPYELEWDYALHHDGNINNMLAKLDKHAWYFGNSNGTAHSVGKKQATQSGIYDLLGNVREWCFDQYKNFPNYNCDTNNECSELRVVKGGSFADFDTVFNGFFRCKQIETLGDEFTGFRVVFQNAKGS